MEEEEEEEEEEEDDCPVSCLGMTSIGFRGASMSNKALRLAAVVVEASKDEVAVAVDDDGVLCWDGMVLQLPWLVLALALQ